MEKKVYTAEEAQEIRDKTYALLSARESALLGELGAIAAFRIVQSNSSATVIREQSKVLDKQSIEFRASLIEFGKTLRINDN